MSKGVYLPETENAALKWYVIDSRAAYTPRGIGGTDLRLLRWSYSPPLHPMAGVAVRVAFRKAERLEEKERR